MYPDKFKKYEIYARTNLYKKRLERAKEVIQEALAKNIKWYVALSGGKDSVVLSHLINSFIKIPVWSQKDNTDFPGCLEYVESLAKKYTWDLTIEKSHVNLTKDIAICEDIHSKNTAFAEYFFKKIEKIEEKYDGVFLGLRCQESKGRHKNFTKRGYIYQRKNGKFTCIPLATWLGDDIFAYIVSNEIPLFDLYFKDLFVSEPTQLRMDWYLPSSFARKGHCVWLKYYYPELFGKLVEIYPEVRNYV